MINRLALLAMLATGSPATAQAQTGNWQRTDETSPLTGARTLAAITQSRNPVANMLGHADRASLVIRCGESGIAVFVNWPQVVSYDGRNFVGSVKTLGLWRIDDGKLQANYWDISSTGTAAGEFKSKNAIKLLSSLVGARRLVVRLTGQQTQDAEFDLTGIDEIAAQTAAACGVKLKA